MRNQFWLSTKLYLLTGFVATATAHPASALDVSIKGLRNTQGDVVVCIWRTMDKGFPNCGTGSPWKKLSASAAEPRVTFKDLPPGVYAVSMLHDEKRIGKPATNLIGMPTSGVGLANNPSLGPTSPPTFKKGRVVVPDVKSITITAKYLF
ncbi:MAG: DUF2141 domain-containing protein [Pseudomonadota bacterium]